MKRMPLSFIKLIALWILFVVHVLSAQENKISFTFENESLEKVIEFLIKNYNIPIAYQDKQIAGIKINAQCHDCSIEEAIKDILKDTPINALQLNTQIILTEHENAKDHSRHRIITGKIIDAKDNASLPYANILIKGYNKGVISNLDGTFTLTDLPSKPITLKVLYMGYRDTERKLTAENNQDTLIIALNQDSLESEAIVVRDKKPDPVQMGEQAGRITLYASQLDYIPAIGGAYLERAIQLMPGTGSGFDVPTKFSFYGGTFDQNMFLLDGIPFIRPYHYYGLISAFPPQTIKKIDIYKGNFPAQYNNSLSGIIDATVNTVPQNKFNMGFNMDLFNYGGFMEWPVNDKLKWFLAARSSYNNIGSSSKYYKDLTKVARGYNTFAKNVDSNFGTTFFLPIRFYDLISKLNYNISKYSNVSFTFYYGKDLEKWNPDTLVNADGDRIGTLKVHSDYSNLGFASSYKYKWAENINSELSYVYSKSQDDSYSKEIYDSTGTINSDYLDKFTFQNIMLKSQYIHKNFIYDFGFKIRRLIFKNQYDSLSQRQDYIGYIQVQWQKPKKFNVSAGINTTNLNYFEPRLAFVYDLLKNLKISGSWGLYYQFEKQRQNLYNNLIYYDDYNTLYYRSVTGQNDKPEQAENGLFGIHYTSPSFIIGGTLYYKNYHRVGLDDYAFPEIYYGRIYSKGFELVIRKDFSFYRGQVSYNYSTLKFKFPDINAGQPWIFNLNREHQIKMLSTFKYKNWTFSITDIYGSSTGDMKILPVSRSNPKGLPYYNRTDLSIQKPLKNALGINWVFKAGIANIFNRKNTRLRLHQETQVGNITYQSENITYGLSRTYFAGFEVSLR